MPVRATVPNPAGALIDGQLVRVRSRGKPEEKVLVPQTALLADQQGTIFSSPGRQGGDPPASRSAARRARMRFSTSGLSGGEQVIVQGMESLRPGAAVSASRCPRP